MKRISNFGTSRTVIGTGAIVSNKHEKLAKQVGAKFNLTVCEMKILYCLYLSGKPHTIRYISRNTHYSKCMISRCVDVLQQNGYLTVVRDLIDRRAVRISLTEKSMPAVQAFAQAEEEFEERLYADLSEKEINELNHILQVVEQNMTAV